MSGENLELDDLVVRPGTYFNPRTEVVVIVDDSASIDQEVFNLDDLDDGGWVHVSDDVPVDEQALEQAIEAFQTSYHPVSRDAVEATRPEHGDDEIHPDEGVADLEPDPDPEDE
ncbi:MAG: hypothetical protein M3331_01545 [Actinomycetota bacterium]|nr:hypothetical protein [Actinomycetota bacterium]